MNKYKVGDKVRIKATNEEGEILDIKQCDFTFLVELAETHVWFREAELCDPAPVKVGDVIEGFLHGEREVLEVFENSFVIDSGNVWTFEQLNKTSWQIKGQDTCPHCGQVKEK